MFENIVKLIVMCTFFPMSTFGSEKELNQSIFNNEIITDFIVENTLKEAFPYGESVYVHLKHDVEVSLGVQTVSALIGNRVNTKTDRTNPPRLVFYLTPNALDKERNGEIRLPTDYRLNSNDKKCVYAHIRFPNNQENVQNAIVLIDTNQSDEAITSCIYSGSLRAFGLRNPFVSTIEIVNKTQKDLLAFIDFIAIEVSGQCRNISEDKKTENFRTCVLTNLSNQPRFWISD